MPNTPKSTSDGSDGDSGHRNEVSSVQRIFTTQPRWMSDEIKEDGLYRAQNHRFTVGFTVKGGIIDSCAPILRRLIYRRLPSLAAQTLKRLGYRVEYLGKGKT